MIASFGSHLHSVKNWSFHSEIRSVVTRHFYLDWHCSETCKAADTRPSFESSSIQNSGIWIMTFWSLQCQIFFSFLWWWSPSTRFSSFEFQCGTAVSFFSTPSLAIAPSRFLRKSKSFLFSSWQSASAPYVEKLKKIVKKMFFFW